MVFKRRNPRSYAEIATGLVYPRGGWGRAMRYMVHRVRRLPDQPHRVGRGVAAGIFVSFTPLFGMHFLAAAACAWLIGGNILAALLATFVGNPITFPFIAVGAVSLGRWILGINGELTPHLIFGEFNRAGKELWHNIGAVFGDTTAHWGHLIDFFHQVYWPYMVGGLLPGLLVAVIGHYLTVPLVRGHHKRREKKMAERVAKLRQRTAAALAETAGAAQGPTPLPADRPLPADTTRPADAPNDQ